MKKKSGTDQPKFANQVADNSDNEALGISDIKSKANSMPGLETAYDSKEVNSIDDEMTEDWFLDVSNDWDTLCSAGCSTDELSGVDSKGSSFSILTWN